MPIHILMKILKYTYCGKEIVKDLMYVMYDFYLPMNMMCNICVDEWENEDIRMKTPQKTTKLMDVNKKD